MATPIIALEDSSTAVVIRRDVSEPVSYQGRNLIELDFSKDNLTEQEFFMPLAFEVPESPGGGGSRPVGELELPDIKDAVAMAFRTGYLNRTLFPSAALAIGSVRLEAGERTKLRGTVPLSPVFENVDPEGIAHALKSGQRLHTFKLVDGTLTFRLTDPPSPDPEPRLYLVETYRLSTHLGDYGAGRVVKTFSLLPGEQTKISVRSFRRSEELRKESSSILDSVTSESAEEFQTELESEQSDKQSYQKTFEYHAEAEAKASWGWGSAKVSGGVKGSTNAAREEFSKNVARATEQHSAKASAKREVEINTSTEVTEITEEETSIEREVSNINVGRVLNFVFRQMNQEFFTLLHLIDVRIAFFNGHPQSRLEVPLYNLQSLLDQVVQPAHHPTVLQAVRDSLNTIMDYEGNLVTNFIEERTLPDSAPYLRVNTSLVSTFTDPIGGATFRVPGVITTTTRNVMRTEGVIVEAILGEASALDTYATRLQELEIRRREEQVELSKAEADRAKMLNSIVQTNDSAQADLLSKLNCDCDAKQPLFRIQVETNATLESSDNSE